MGSSSAPAGYQPTGQSQADQSYQSLNGQLAGAASQLSSSAIPAYNQLYQNVASNPFYATAQSGANAASQTGLNSVAPSQFSMGSATQQAGNMMGANAQSALQTGQANYNQNMALNNQDQSLAAQYQTLAGQDQNLANYAMQSYGMRPDLMTSATQNSNTLLNAIPQATAGYGLAMPTFDQMTGNANTAWNESQAALGALVPGGMGAANQILQTGFDPQQQLYNQQYQQMQEQTNAIAAQQGVSGSPFAAGVAGQNSQNFNMDWQNQQLQRQISALGAYDGATSTAANNFSSLMGAGSGAYGNLMNSGVNNFNSLTNGATSNLNGLVTGANNIYQTAQQQQFQDVLNSEGQATQDYATLSGQGLAAQGTGLAVQQQGLNAQAQGQSGLNSGYANMQNLYSGQQQAYGAASDLNTAGLNTMTTSAMYPNEVYMNNQSQILQALNAMVGGTNQALQPTNQAISNNGNYLQLGQSATANAQNAASINNAANAQMMSGFGQMAGMALAPFTGGLSLGATAGLGGGSMGL